MFELGIYLVAAAILIPKAMKSYESSADLFALRGEEELKYEEIEDEKKRLVDICKEASRLFLNEWEWGLLKIPKLKI